MLINMFKLLVIFLFCFFGLYSQEYKAVTIAFYNVENLFDCEDDLQTFDNDFTPLGKFNWTEERLNFKLEKIAKTISLIGAFKTKRPPLLIGLCEVENKIVLERLVNQESLSNIDYGIVHYNSPDRRGIDTALLYDRTFFKILNSQKHRLELFNELNETIHTRDQLCVSGYLDEELIYCIVNHWPSRRGGVKKSEPRRINAAELTNEIMDSIYSISRNANIIVMGDFNDNPNNKSFYEVLNSNGDITAMNNLYNPMEALYKKGIGSLGYRDQWSLFDQILFSKSLTDTIGWKCWKSNVYNADFLKNRTGRYKGYPKRTFSGGRYTKGYSDHFPVYTYLIKKVFK